MPINTDEDPPDTIRTFTYTAAVTGTNTGRHVEIITIVPASK